MNLIFGRKGYKQEVQYYEGWLERMGLLDISRGMSETVFHGIPSCLLSEIQKNTLAAKLTSYTQFSRFWVYSADGIVKIDDELVITPYRAMFHTLINKVCSRPLFIKLLYQYVSYFPTTLFEAYQGVTGESLFLDECSEIREFYETCCKLDLWTAHELCAYISHCDPDAVDFISTHPEAHKFLSEDIESQGYKPHDLEKLFPNRFSPLLLRPELYEKNLNFVKSAIFGGAFELIHFDRDDWINSSFKPKVGLEWAKKKGIAYHPVMDEYLLDSDIKPEASSLMSSGYTTPYLEMMLEVISELEISKENQGKKEAIAALFAKKLADHKATPQSQKLADAMATLVRMPESQQGRAKPKG